MRSIRELLDLSDRCVLLTGGAGHVGRAFAETFVELGARVALVDIDAAGCEEIAKTLRAIRPDTAVPIVCDLADESAARGAVRQAAAALGGLDVLVHAAAWVGTTAAAGWTVPFDAQTVAAWDAAMRLNVTSAFVLVQEARAALERSGHGAVVLVSSIYGMIGPDPSLYEGTAMANPAGYGVSKGALLLLTRHLATVLAPRIRVNAISAGGIRRGQPEIFRHRYEARTPLARMGTEEDLTGAVAYLASDLSAYVTGHNLVVDGGWTTW